MNTLFYALLLALMPVLSLAAAQPTGIGSVAENMLDPLGLISDFVYMACFTLGASFLFAAIVKYFDHRRSPLMVPISTVIFFFVAGILLLLLPCLSYLSGTGLGNALWGNK
jgi:hypothetical protein